MSVVVQMTDDPFQHLSRVAGLTAYALLWLNVCIGLGLRASVGLPIMKRWRAADLHQFVAVLALGFLALHVVVLLGLRQQAFSFVELWVPLARSAPATIGIVALYLTVLVVVTSGLRRHLDVKVWRAMHGLSLVGFALGLGHAVMAGPDANAPWARLMYWSTAAVLVVLLTHRLWLVGRPRTRRRTEPTMFSTRQSTLYNWNNNAFSRKIRLTHARFAALDRAGWPRRARGARDRRAAVYRDGPDGRQCADASSVISSEPIRSWSGTATH